MLVQKKLPNGCRMVIERRSSPIVCVQISVGVGSDDENLRVAGISHFLEHMLFEGSTTRTTKEISEAIENVGGELNAATSNERTFYYAKVPRKHFAMALEILADVVFNPVFDPKMLEKERNVILEEIKMTDDQPLQYQWILFEKTLWKKLPAKNPTYGTVETVKAITRKDMIDYHQRWYCPQNIIVSVVGDAPGAEREIKRWFDRRKSTAVPELPKVTEPVDNRALVKREKRGVQQAYMNFGYKTVPRRHPDSVVLDVISAVFCKGLSGRIVDEIRIKRGLVYSVGCTHQSLGSFGFFAVYLNAAKKNIEPCRRIILQEIGKLSTLSKRELDEAKDYIEGKLIMSTEDHQHRADILAFWESVSSAKDAESYLKDVEKVSKADVLRVAQRYLNKNYTMTVVE
ncbi:insulinase family protein [Candidatus Woesearchaeota archaeon]|nr:insulinase family protein [Candidatus Woesearchaeota archaeon]